MKPCYLRLRMVRIRPVTMRWRLRYYKKHQVTFRPVKHLMRLASEDMHSVVLAQLDFFPFHFQYRRSFEDKEKLLRLVVMMPRLRRSRRHALIDHAQLAVSYQVPAVAVGSPGVMLGVFWVAYHLAFHVACRFSSHALIPSCASSVFINSSR